MICTGSGAEVDAYHACPAALPAAGFGVPHKLLFTLSSLQLRNQQVKRFKIYCHFQVAAGLRFRGSFFLVLLEQYAPNRSSGCIITYIGKPLVLINTLLLMLQAVSCGKSARAEQVAETGL